jgi:putative transposase
MERRNHVAIWKWIQRYKPERTFYKRRKVSEFIIDETQIKIGENYFWIWVAIEPDNKASLLLIFQQKGICLLQNVFFKD